jgi:hypothetical protein
VLLGIKRLATTRSEILPAASMTSAIRSASGLTERRRLRGTHLAGLWPTPWIAGILLMIPIANWQTSAPAVMSGNRMDGSGCILAGYRYAVVGWGELAVLAGWLTLRGLDDLDTGRDSSAPCPSRARQGGHRRVAGNSHGRASESGTRGSRPGDGDREDTALGSSRRPCCPDESRCSFTDAATRPDPLAWAAGHLRRQYAGNATMGPLTCGFLGL